MEEFNANLRDALLDSPFATVSLKTEQEDAIKHLYNQEDVFVWLPTGFGKSIIYQVFPLLMDYMQANCSGASSSSTDVPPSLVIVVSPLISLMIDQVTNLLQSRIKAAIMTSCKPEADHYEGHIPDSLIATKDDFRHCSLLYVSPEALMTPKWRSCITDISKRIVAVAVDEAHCISKWYDYIIVINYSIYCKYRSKDFRPAYMRINEIRAILKPGVPFNVLTTTATESIKQDILHNLEMSECQIVYASPNRSNIYFSVYKKN